MPMDLFINSICLFFVFIVRGLIIVVILLVGFVDEPLCLNHQRIILGEKVDQKTAHMSKSLPFASLSVIIDPTPSQVTAPTHILMIVRSVERYGL
mmetsp:Transcript_29445/g.73468  ORF Transcript_29445/g.73468 Transcript_29445/m.73468 type:complete len:95 (+) Transcript_29445:148-432(+)